MVGKEGRRWFPLSNAFTRDDRVIAAGERAGWLYVAILGHIAEHNRPGVITEQEISVLGIKGWRRRRDQLISVGLLDKDAARDDTYWIPAWRSWHNESATPEAVRVRRYRQRRPNP